MRIATSPSISLSLTDVKNEKYEKYIKFKPVGYEKFVNKKLKNDINCM